MHEDAPRCSFERLTDLETAQPTLIEGLPGMGLVASIAVDEITDQLGLEHHGNIHSEAFPPVASFHDGRTRDLVRVYANQDPPVMTLQSDIPTPGEATRSLARCVFEDLSPSFDRAIFLVGAPAANEETLGDVHGVATTDAQRGELQKAGIDLAEGAGAIGGPTGALLSTCHDHDVPAIALIVRANPRLPDPGAARSAIDNALEPLVDFSIDTSTLQERAEEIRRQKQNVAHQVQQTGSGAQAPGESSDELAMFH